MLEKNKEAFELTGYKTRIKTTAGDGCPVSIYCVFIPDDNVFAIEIFKLVDNGDGVDKGEKVVRVWRDKVLTFRYVAFKGGTFRRIIQKYYELEIHAIEANKKDNS